MWWIYMTCGEAREYLFAFLDGELDAAVSMELQRHLEHCPVCAHDVEVERSIRRRLGELLVPGEAATAAERALDRVRRATPATADPRVWVRRLALACGSIAAAVVLAVGAWSHWWGPQREGVDAILVDLLVGDFEKFVAEGHPVQLASSDATQVEDWLQQQTGLAVALRGMTDDGCRLLGGRKCSIRGQAAAFAFYQVDGASASVVALPSAAADLAVEASTDPATKDRSAETTWTDHCRGHTVVACLEEGLIYAAVGVLPEEELGQLLPATCGTK